MWHSFVSGKPYCLSLQSIFDTFNRAEIERLNKNSSICVLRLNSFVVRLLWSESQSPKLSQTFKSTWWTSSQKITCWLDLPTTSRTHIGKNHPVRFFDYSSTLNWMEVRNKIKLKLTIRLRCYIAKKRSKGFFECLYRNQHYYCHFSLYLFSCL